MKAGVTEVRVNQTGRKSTSGSQNGLYAKQSMQSKGPDEIVLRSGSHKIGTITVCLIAL